MAGATNGRLLQFGDGFAILGPMISAPGAVYGRGSYACLGPGMKLDHGQFKVTGYTLTIATLAPLYRYVRLLDDLAGSIIRGTVSRQSDGYYEFLYLPAGTYTVVGVDQNGVQNGVVAAHVVAVAM